MLKSVVNSLSVKRDKTSNDASVYHSGTPALVRGDGFEPPKISRSFSLTTSLSLSRFSFLFAQEICEHGVADIRHRYFLDHISGLTRLLDRMKQLIDARK